jgi:hypothetical protein
LCLGRILGWELVSAQVAKADKVLANQNCILARQNQWQMLQQLQDQSS